MRIINVRYLVNENCSLILSVSNTPNENTSELFIYTYYSQELAIHIPM